MNLARNLHTEPIHTDNVPANKIPDDNRGRYRFKMNMAFENENGLWDSQSSAYLGVIGIRTIVCLALSLWANLFVECDDILINLWVVLGVSLALHSSTHIPVRTGKVMVTAMKPSQSLIMWLSLLRFRYDVPIMG